MSCCDDYCHLAAIVLYNFSAIAFVSGRDYSYEERTALRYTDVFINCSVDPIDAHTSWEFESAPIFYSNDKYSKNNSGLTIHNFSEEDQGRYRCILGHVDPLNATILLNIVCKLLNTIYV